DLRTVKVSCGIVATFGIVLDCFNAHDLAEARPALIINPCDTDITVSGAESAPDTMEKWMAAAGALGFLTRQGRIVDLKALRGDHRAVNRCVDTLTLASTFTGKERGEDAASQSQRPGLIGDSRA